MYSLSAPSEEPLSSCGECQSRVPTGLLKRHLRAHFGYLPYACHLCSCRFFTYPEAQAHFAYSEIHPPGTQLFIIEELDVVLEQQLAASLGRPKPVFTATPTPYRTPKRRAMSPPKGPAYSPASTSPELASRPSSVLFEELDPALARRVAVLLERPSPSFPSTPLETRKRSWPSPAAASPAARPGSSQTEVKSEAIPCVDLCDDGDSDIVPFADAASPSTPATVKPEPVGEPASATTAMEPAAKRTKRVPSKKALCGDCGEAVPAGGRLGHLLRGHLKRPRFQCHPCSYDDFSWRLKTKAGIVAHMRRRHGLVFSPACADVSDHKAALEVELAAALKTCFPDAQPLK